MWEALISWIKWILGIRDAVVVEGPDDRGEEPMAWRVAKSLLKLRDQINERHPKRKKHIDGTIGDAAHASRASDHNPHVKDGNMGIVTALDLTHSPAEGFDAHKFCESLRLGRDNRIKYVISNARIFSSTTSPWVWRNYTGSNPHRSHVHVSVKATKVHYDSVTSWSFIQGASPPPSPEGPGEARPVLRRGSSGEPVKVLQRLLMAVTDGSFGPITETAVKVFQRGAGLVADGVVGPLTWNALDKLEEVPRAHGGEDDEGEDIGA